MKVLFNDVKAAHVAIASELDAAIQRVLRSGRFILGQELETFEAEFAAYCGVKHCVGVASGTEALQLALLACGIGPDDEVITVAHTAMPTALAIAATGATPVFVDIDPQTYTLRPDQLEEALSPKTRAIVPVHLYGHCADMGAILEFAARQKLCVIEDAAQAHGSTYNGRKAGSMGHMGCFSFYPSKNLSAYGEGGALTTNDAGIAELARSLRNHGQSGPYIHERIGYNYRMDGFQGAVLRVKLKRLEQWNARRKEIAALYRSVLKGAKVEILLDDPRDERVYHLFVVYVERRDAVRAALQAREVHTAIHYPRPVPLQPAFAALGFGPGSFPHAERACERALSMPFFPEMTDEQVQYAGKQLAEVAGNT